MVSGTTAPPASAVVAEAVHSGNPVAPAAQALVLYYAVSTAVWGFLLLAAVTVERAPGVDQHRAAQNLVNPTKNKEKLLKHSEGFRPELLQCQNKLSLMSKMHTRL